MKQCMQCMYALSPVKSGDPCQEVQGSGLCHRPPVGLYGCGGLTLPLGYNLALYKTESLYEVILKVFSSFKNMVCMWSGSMGLRGGRDPTVTAKLPGESSELGRW